MKQTKSITNLDGAVRHRQKLVLHQIKSFPLRIQERIKLMTNDPSSSNTWKIRWQMQQRADDSEQQKKSSPTTNNKDIQNKYDKVMAGHHRGATATLNIQYQWKFSASLDHSQPTKQEMKDVTFHSNSNQCFH